MSGCIRLLHQPQRRSELCPEASGTVKIVAVVAILLLLAGCSTRSATPPVRPRAPQVSDRPNVGPSPTRRAPEAAAAPVAGPPVAVAPSPSPSKVDWRRIDAHARATPKAASASVKSLAKHLAKPAKTDAEKARALFTWMALNIDYDTEAFFADRPSAGTPEEVLRTRLSVCNGYARLYEALAKEVGLEAKLVSGFARGYGVKPGDPIPKESNHAWNVVKVDGEWRLVDSTWGAGHLDQGGTFVREFDDFWFLTPPKDFLSKHLPEEPRWQLVEPPVDAKAFAALPDVTSEFHRAGLRLENHETSTIRAEGPLTVEVGAPPRTQVFADLRRDGRELEGLTFVQRREGGFTIRALFPKTGTYTLSLYAGPRGRDVLPTAVEWRVQVAKATPGATWPETFLHYSERDARLAKPMTGTLRAGKAVEFDLEAPGAQEMMVQSSAGQVKLSRKGARFTGRVTPGAGEVILFARYPGKERFDGLVRYRAE